MKKLVLPLIAITALLTGCEKQFDVKLMACAVDTDQCITMAKFDNVESCERMRALSDAYCDQVSVPGKIVCDTQKKSTITRSYCSK